MSLNPLSLDMGCKSKRRCWLTCGVSWSQSAFAGYGLEEMDRSNRLCWSNKVAIRFRWIWVGRDEKDSSFRPFGDVAIRFRWIWVGRDNQIVGDAGGPIVAIRFRWIWVGRALHPWVLRLGPNCRNPLSLDMGWKSFAELVDQFTPAGSQSAFAGYGLEEYQSPTGGVKVMKSQSAFAGYGLEEI